MVQNKHVVYVAGGLLAIVGLYFLYKSGVSAGAKKSMKGALTGYGGQALKSIGLSPDQIPFLSKDEAKASVDMMQATKSPVQDHSASIRPAPKQAPISKNGLFSKQSVATRVQPGSKTTRRTTTMDQARLGARGIGGGRTTTKPPILSKPAVVKTPRPTPTVSRSTPTIRSPVSSGAASSGARYSGRRPPRGRGYIR